MLDSNLSSLKIKISCDGTNVGRKLKLVAVTFTIIEDKRSVASKGNNLVALLTVPEKYQYIQASLKDLSSEITELKTVTVRDRTFTLDYHLGGDYKSLVLISGIESCTSKYSCVFCKCGDRGDFTLDWTMTDTNRGARTIEQIQECLKKSQKLKNFHVNMSLYSQLFQ